MASLVASDWRDQSLNWMFPWWRGRGAQNKALLLFTPFVDILTHIVIAMFQLVFFRPKPEHNYMEYIKWSLEHSTMFQIKCSVAFAFLFFGLYVWSDEYRWRRKTLTAEYDIPPMFSIRWYVVGFALFWILGPVDYSPWVESVVKLLWLAIVRGPLT